MDNNERHITVMIPGIEGTFQIRLGTALETERQLCDLLKSNCGYEADVASFFMRALRPGDIVVDVGANVGWFTLLSAMLVGPSGKVLSCEPAPENISRLQYNITLNKYDNVSVFTSPMSCDAHDDTFYINPEGNGGHALWEMSKESTSLHVRTSCLDDIVPPDVVPRIIKIDVEGYESDVLRGAQKLLRRSHPPYIIAEFHFAGMTHRNETQVNIRELMRKHGYETFILAQDGHLPMLIPHRTVLATGYIQNALFATCDDVGEIWPEFACGMGVRHPMNHQRRN